MRIATYNVEWFNSLFDDNGQMLEDDGPSARYKISRRDQLAALGIVFSAMDADAVMVIEAPDSNRRRDTVAMLELFARTCGLRARKAIIGFSNHTQQEIALLFDPDQVTPRHDPAGYAPGHDDRATTPRFDGHFRIDLDIDMAPEDVTFSKPPLELALETRGGKQLRLIGVHVKSKAPIGAESRAHAVRIAIENRRKQLAQCIWLRKRVEEVLAAGQSLMVLGDLNDGPGLDTYEELFGRSGVEIVMGWDAAPETRLFDPNARAAGSGRPTAGKPATARFWNNKSRSYVSALLDYIMVSPDLAALRPDWRIWHPFDDPACYDLPELREALLTASDHFPVSVDIAL